LQEQDVKPAIAVGVEQRHAPYIDCGMK